MTFCNVTENYLLAQWKPFTTSLCLYLSRFWFSSVMEYILLVFIWVESTVSLSELKVQSLKRATSKASIVKIKVSLSRSEGAAYSFKNVIKSPRKQTKKNLMGYQSWLWLFLYHTLDQSHQDSCFSKEHHTLRHLWKL